MRKVLIALLTLIIIGAIGYFLIPVNSEKKNFDYSVSLNAIPSRAAFVFRCENIVKNWSQFNNSTIGQALQESNLYQNFGSFFTRLDSSANAINSNFFNMKFF